MTEARPPIVSVVMPCYNGRQFVLRGLASVLEQGFEQFELLFIDDGSIDGSADLAAGITDARLRVIRLPHGGVSHARNQGIAQARGQFIAFLDVDDVWDAGFLAKMVGVLERRPECAIAYCGWQNIGLPGGRGEPYVPRVLDGLRHPDQLLECCPWPIHAALTRADAIRGTGGFATDLAVGEDFLLWLEIACFHPIVRVPEVLAYYNHHGVGQASRQGLQASLQAFAAQQIFLRRHPEVGRRLGRKRVRDLTLGPLLQRGYESYWKGDLEIARGIFRRVLRSGYGRPRDWVYMLPSLLPTGLHRHAVGMIRSRSLGS